LVSLADLADRVLDEADVVRLEVFEVLAAAERGLGNYDAAVEAASRALGQCERFECQVPLWGDLQLELALALHERGDAFASARAAAEKADRIYARLPGEPHSIRQRAKIAQTFARGTSG
jgi:hypothetical protein